MFHVHAFLQSIINLADPAKTTFCNEEIHQFFIATFPIAKTLDDRFMQLSDRDKVLVAETLAQYVIVIDQIGTSKTADLYVGDDV
jgi:hypothetical protein